MIDKKKLMSDLEGLTFDDWHTYHCDSDVQGIAIDALEFLKKQPQWISVKDSRPKDQKPVIVYVPPHTNRYGDEFIGYVGMAYYTYSVNGGYWCGTDGNLYGAIGAIAAPSHWMPLPEPPEVKQDD